jgi:TIGR03009 family protein
MEGIMTVRVALTVALGMLLSTGHAIGQSPQYQAPPQGQFPRLQQLNSAQQPVQGGQSLPQQAVQPPFSLTPYEVAQLDKILDAWEKSSSHVKTFEAEFTRFEYDQVFGKPDQPKTTEKGQVKFAAPDRGLFAIDGQQPEKWICDGKAIYEYDYRSKLLTEHRLPPELQGKAITDGPLPFLFGAPAAQLKQRYFLRTVTPAAELQKAIWLQALPRFQHEKANFDEAVLIIDAKSLQPAALKIYLPGGKSSFTFVFENIRVNDPLGFLKVNSFHASTPFGWRRTVEEAPQLQASQQAPAQGGRRQ